MFRSIQWRMAVPILIIILGSMGILGAYLVNSARDTETDNLRTLLVNEAKITAEASILGFTDPYPTATLDNLAKMLGEQTDARFTIIGRDGTVLGDSQEDPLVMKTSPTVLR